MNQLNEKLAVIRRQKKVYIKYLEDIIDISERKKVKDKIDTLSFEEKRIVEQLIK